MKTAPCLRAALVLVTIAGSALAQCPDWATTYVQPGADQSVIAAVYHDDGQGERLYVGGGFTRIGETLVNRVARWNGVDFEPVGSLAAYVYALHSLDTGGGRVLYAVGSVAPFVFRFDGASWIGLPSGAGTGDLVVFDDGSGPKLYSARAGPAARIVRRFDGTSWTDVGNGFDDYLGALAVYDDGTGPALYVGGEFRNWNGTPCRRVARWDGSAWIQAGGGIGAGFVETVLALEVFDDGQGPRLIAGGDFQISPSQLDANIAAFDGVTWSALGTGLGGAPTGGCRFPVTALHVASVGGSPRLFAGGDFTTADGSPAGHTAAWDGSAWSNLANGVAYPPPTVSCGQPTVHAITSPQAGGALVVGGTFASAGDRGARHLARWDGAAWHPLVDGQSLDGEVATSTIHDDGSGKRVYVGGRLRAAGTQAVRLVARFDGSTWERVGPMGPDTNTVEALASIDFGAGPLLIAGGTFDTIGGTPMGRLAAWDGSQWNAFAPMTHQYPGNIAVRSLVVDGSVLYVGGTFHSIGGVAANGIARFDGTTWSAVGSGFADGQVHVLGIFDQGFSRELYAGGTFTGRIARFDGSSWIGLPQPPAGNGGTVLGLQTFFDGTSARLFVGGSWTTIGGVQTTYNIASWNGSAWTTYGIGTSGVQNAQFRCFRVFDDGLGAGPKLFVGGYFASIQDQPGFSVISWDGTQWASAAPGGGVTGPPSSGNFVGALDVLDDGTSTSLFAFGGFESSNLGPAYGVARYGRDGTPGCDPVTGFTHCDGSGSGAACPCANVGAPGRGCNNSSSTGGARLVALGAANVRADDVTLRVDGVSATSPCLFFQGTIAHPGSLFGDGIRCVAGSQIRLAIRIASGGIARFGASVPGDPSLSVAGGITSATTRAYQVWYRDAASFCTSSTFNLSNGLLLRWAY